MVQRRSLLMAGGAAAVAGAWPLHAQERRFEPQPGAFKYTISCREIKT